MDLFTEKANSIIKSIKPLKDVLEEEKVVYSSEEEEAKEEQAEDASSTVPDKTLKALGLDPKAIAAISVAQKMSTQAARSSFRQDPQKVMNTAYGKLMTSIAGKINDLSKSIQ